MGLRWLGTCVCCAEQKNSKQALQAALSHGEMESFPFSTPTNSNACKPLIQMPASLSALKGMQPWQHKSKVDTHTKNTCRTRPHRTAELPCFAALQTPRRAASQCSLSLARARPPCLITHGSGRTCWSRPASEQQRRPPQKMKAPPNARILGNSDSRA